MCMFVFIGMDVVRAGDMYVQLDRQIVRQHAWDAHAKVQNMVTSACVTTRTPHTWWLLPCHSHSLTYSHTRALIPRTTPQLHC